MWSVEAPQQLSRPAARAIERADRVFVATMTIFELVGLVERRRLDLSAPIRTWVQRALGNGLEALPLTTTVAVDAAQLRFVADPADRVIYATARAEGAKLVTRDEKIRAFDPAIAVW